ncbi:MAG: uroporphyrinogen decarboxylase, partial [Eubacterium sp.]
NLKEAQWQPGAIAPAAEKVCAAMYSDINPAGTVHLRFPSFYEALKAQAFRMANNGFMQHPEVEGMKVEDYDAFIKNPYDCILEKLLPRLYKNLDMNHPAQYGLSFAKALLIHGADVEEGGAVAGKLIEKYGYYPGNGQSDTFTEAPFDMLADQLRSFSGIIRDIRKMPDKVVAACEAIYPLALSKGVPKKINAYSRCRFPLHMATFMRETDFKKVWWPTFLQITHTLASKGVQISCIVEDDWMRYLDYLEELPANSQLTFEYGDPKKIKEKLGKRHIISGLYPVTLPKTGSKQQCIDKAKELVDSLAPGGKYIFDFDKNIISSNSFKMENLAAVTEFVRTYAVYQHPGGDAGEKFRKEDYKEVPGRPLESKYLKTSEAYKEENPFISDYGIKKLRSYDQSVFDFVKVLLV